MGLTIPEKIKSEIQEVKKIKTEEARSWKFPIRPAVSERFTEKRIFQIHEKYFKPFPVEKKYPYNASF